MVKLAEWMYKGSTHQPKSSRSAGGGAAGNTLVLGCNGTLTEMQETDFCKLQHTACNPSTLKETLALLAIFTKQFKVAAASLPISTSVRPPSIGIGTTEVYSIYIRKVCCV